MRITIFLLFVFISLNSSSQNLFHKLDIKKQLKEDIDYDYLDEENLKKGINKEIAFTKATKAIERMNLGDFNKAYQDSKEIIDLDPDSDYPYILKGLCAIELDSLDQAKQAFLKANQIDDFNSIPLFYLGYLSRIDGDDKSAKNYYQAIIKIDKKSFLGYYGLGNMYFFKGNYLDAKQYYYKAIKINPDFYEGFYNLGIIEIVSNQPKRAIEYLKSSIIVDSKFSNAYYLLGFIYYFYYDSDKLAKQYWDKAIDLKPDKLTYLLSRAIWYLNNDNIEKGYYDISQAIELNEGDKYIFSDFGDFNDEKVKNTVKQIVIFDKNIQYVPDTIKSKLKWYLSYLMYEDYISAKEKIDEAYNIDSVGSVINYMRGNEYENYSYYDDAIKYYQKSLKVEPILVDTYLKLGKLYFGKEEYNLSIDYLSKFLNYNDTANIAYRLRGTAYMKLSLFDKALNDFNIFIDKDSTDFDVLFNKGVSNQKLKDYTEAISAFKKAIMYKKDSYESYYLSAECKFELKDYKGASQDLDSISSEYYNSNFKSYYLKGKIEYEMKNYKEAIFNFSAALNIEPNNIDIISDRGKLYYTVGDNLNALKYYEQLIEIDSEISAAYYIRGVIHVKLKQFSEACSDFKIAESKGYPVPQNAFSICNINI